MHKLFNLRLGFFYIKKHLGNVVIISFVLKNKLSDHSEARVK